MKRLIIFTMILMLVAGVSSVSAEKCKVRINTSPQGATFTVNLAILKFGPTPFSLDFERGKNYRLTFSKDGYETKVVEYKADCKDLEVTLKREGGGFSNDTGGKSANLLVSSNVPNASVYIDDDLKGTAPLRMKLAYGKYRFRVSARGYGDYTETVNVNRTAVEVNATLEKEKPARHMSNVRVNANVNDARVYVDDDYKGTTPIMLKLEYGTYRFKIEKPGYDTYLETEKIDRNAVEINVELDRDRESRVQIQSNIKGADVYINDQLKGKTPLNLRLDYGTYDVLVTLDGFEDYFETIEIKSRQEKIDAILERAERVNLKVISNIAGADVFLNNRKVGKTPLSIQRPSGNYRLRVSLPDSGFDDFTTKIRLKKEDVEVEAVLESDDVIVIELPVRSKVKVDDYWYDINWDQPERKKAATTVVTIYASAKRKGQAHDLYIEFAGLVMSKQVKFYNRRDKAPVLKLGLSIE